MLFAVFWGSLGAGCREVPTNKENWSRRFNDRKGRSGRREDSAWVKRMVKMTPELMAMRREWDAEKRDEISTPLSSRGIFLTLSLPLPCSNGEVYCRLERP